MTIHIIAAVSDNLAIGKNGRIPWKVPSDLRHFKERTLDKTVIMGRKTFESIGRALPNRRNIVLSKSMITPPPNIELFDSLESAINKLRADGVQDVFIIGGQRVYEESLPMADKLHITRVHTFVDDADAFFPAIDPERWRLVSSRKFTKNERDEFDFTIEEYEPLVD